jgi:hypothetical protein
MLGKNVQIGQCYHVKVSGKVVPCRINKKYERFDMKGVRRDTWWATNLTTGREIKILSAQRIRCRAAEPGSEGPKSLSDLFRL